MLNLNKFTSIILAVFLFSLMTGCGRDAIKGEGAAQQESREVKTFSGIEVDGKYNIVGTQGKPQELVISSNANILPYIKSSVDDDTLTIKSDDAVHLTPSVKQGIWFTTETFQKLNLSGETEFQMTVNSEKLDCALQGSHKMLLKGKVPHLKMVINGSANVNAKDMQVKDAEIEINGSGLVSLNVSDKLKVKINGDGKIIYYNGKPKIEQVINGAGQVSSGFGALDNQPR